MCCWSLRIRSLCFVAALLLGGAGGAGGESVVPPTAAPAVQALPTAEKAELPISGPEAGEAVSGGEGAEPTAPLLPPGLEPLRVWMPTGVEAGRNDSNPIWSPSGELLAFERSSGDRKEILVADVDGTIVRRLYLQPPAEEEPVQFFLPGLTEEASYNAGLSWSPGGRRFVFMSNGGGGNYDLYLGSLDLDETPRLTDHIAKDGLADWAPAAERLLFVSGRTGSGDVYLLDLATRALTRLTGGEKEFLYPRWSPDGRKVALIYGSNENHDIYLIEDLSRPRETLRPLTIWPYDDLRPVWSPDGRKIAFYSNFNAEDDPKVWSLLVVAADGSDPAEGAGLEARVVATDVIPDVERGPAWTPDGARIVFIKNDRLSYNPIHVVDLATGCEMPLNTGTKMNHDVTCSRRGVIAFRAQVEQWDHIHLAELPPGGTAAGPKE